MENIKLGKSSSLAASNLRQLIYVHPKEKICIIYNNSHHFKNVFGNSNFFIFLSANQIGFS